MIPEIGLLCLIMALGVALVQAIVPMLGAILRIPAWIRIARPAAYTQFFFVGSAFLILAYSFIVSDFSVLYVAENSNTHMPLIYRIAAVWGAHEGSLLLWATVLTLWTAAVARFSRNIPDEFVARVLSVMGMISIGFLLFMLLTSNPFVRIFPVPAQGRDLNPLLQDPGLAMHPPTLYMGYVGFSVAFALAIAALTSGKLDTAWARWARPWTNASWFFLTMGIVAGSWWSYYVLGWGGWWFWDPVENASFMPWLVGTALVHSLAVTEKRNTFKAWTLLLAMITFSLSLLGTFLVRSGVLTSVHAFASDPARGVFILMFLGVVVGASLLLYAWRGPTLRTASESSSISRESGLLINNVILVTTSASVLLGTLYPLALQAMGLGKISVGPPYFNSVFIPLTIPLALLLGFGTLLRWRQDNLSRLQHYLVRAVIFSIVAGFLFVWVVMPNIKIFALIGMMLFFWVMSGVVTDFRSRFKNRKMTWQNIAAVPRGFYGMILAHMGVAVFIVGISLTTQYSIEKDVRLTPGASYSLAGYKFKMEGIKTVQGPNYTAQQATFVVTHHGKLVTKMYPEKRDFGDGNPLTKAAIHGGITRDLFVALGDKLNNQGAWSVRLYHKPFLRWIWFGGFMMAFGGLIAITDRRYRTAKSTAREGVQNEGATA
ncbi:MAG: heme lyase CcmF/NrfE family subunit [Gammaproteobacteria bacterium]|jgi:cytochrome c-type biogenesis protein CcmF